MRYYKLTILAFLFICSITLSYSAPTHAQSVNLACDPNILDTNRKITDALDQSNAEIIKASIQQPTPIEAMACTDQQVEMISASGQLHANPGGDISNAIGPLAQSSLQNSLDSFSNNVISTTDGFLNPITGAINSVANAMSADFASLIPSLSAMVPSLGTGMMPSLSQAVTAPDANCEMREQVWLLNECVQMPQIPSLSDIVGGKVAELADNVNNFSNQLNGLADTDRLIEQVCSAADSTLQGYFGDLDSAFDEAANIEAISDL